MAEMRTVLEQLVTLQYQLESSDAIEEAKFETGDLSMVARLPDVWFVAVDVFAVVPPARYPLDKVRHSWVMDGGRETKVPLRARPAETHPTLGSRPPTTPEPPPETPDIEPHAETKD